MACLPAKDSGGGNILVHQSVGMDMSIIIVIVSGADPGTRALTGNSFPLKVQLVNEIQNDWRKSLVVTTLFFGI